MLLFFSCIREQVISSYFRNKQLNFFLSQALQSFKPKRLFGSFRFKTFSNSFWITYDCAWRYIKCLTVPAVNFSPSNNTCHMKMGNKSPNLKIVVIHSCTQDGRPLTHRTSSIKGYVSNEIESVTTAHVRIHTLI